MISVVVYGRNDSYGYNLHKRAAISLNCIAEMLSDRDDEILFVDYNTPDDFPTFPEAIQDTLTKKAKRKIRVLRVRPEVHERFRNRTHLVALEPIARNIAARRSNPANRWLLSTNTDIIFVPQGWKNLTRFARGLAPGIYHAPRLEIPESLWEFLDRQQPAKVIRRVKTWGRTLHIDEIIESAPVVKYDAPGDFQLMERQAFFDIGGFDETMLIGWHLDSNISARLRLFYGQISDAGRDFFAYHCDHTRQITPMHRHDRPENSIERYVTLIAAPGLPEQAETWGCPNDRIEEIRLDGASAAGFQRTIASVVGAPLKEPYKSTYSAASFNDPNCDPRHLLSYLVDLFFAMPRDTTVAWFGERADTITLFAQAWKQLGFRNEILVAAENQCIKDIPGTRRVAAPDIYEEAVTLVFEYSTDPEGKVREKHDFAVEAFLHAISAEHARMRRGLPPTKRLVGLNAINTSFEGLFRGFVAAGSTPFSGRMRHGFALPAETGSSDWLPAMKVGPSGEMRGKMIANRPGGTDWICYGPYWPLLPGRYRLSLAVACRDANAGPSVAAVEICAGPTTLAIRRMSGDQSIDFIVSTSLAFDPRSQFEVRIKSLRGEAIEVGKISVECLGEDWLTERQPSFVQELGNFLDFVNVGAIAARGERGIKVKSGDDGHAFSGPYWVLPPRSYVATFDLSAIVKGEGAGKLVLEILGPNDHFLARSEIFAHDLVDRGSVRVPFVVAEDAEKLEFRLWTDGASDIEISGLRVEEV